MYRLARNLRSPCLPAAKRPGPRFWRSFRTVGLPCRSTFGKRSWRGSERAEMPGVQSQAEAFNACETWPSAAFRPGDLGGRRIGFLYGMGPLPDGTLCQREQPGFHILDAGGSVSGRKHRRPRPIDPTRTLPSSCPRVLRCSISHGPPYALPSPPWPSIPVANASRPVR